MASNYEVRIGPTEAVIVTVKADSPQDAISKAIDEWASSVEPPADVVGVYLE